MITYTCPKCGISSERSICGKCGGRTDAESHLYWCPTCKVPLYGKNCENCGQEGVEFAADVRPVFPEERLLIEVLLGKPLRSLMVPYGLQRAIAAMWTGRKLFFLPLSIVKRMRMKFDASGMNGLHVTTMKLSIDMPRAS